jgi:hypothetical protein
MRHIIAVVSLAFVVAACSGDVGEPNPGTPSEDTSSESDTMPSLEDSEGTEDDVTPSVDDDTANGETDAEEMGDAVIDDAPEAPPEDIATTADTMADDIVGPEADVQEPMEDIEAPKSDVAPPVDDTEAPDQGPLLLCHILCDKVWTACGAYSPYGSDQDSCVEACEVMTTTSLDGLVQMSCLADMCDETMCEPIGDEPLIQPLCQEACGLFDSCDLMTVIQPDYPEVLELCSIECSGGFIVDKEFMPLLVGCVVDGLAATCDPNVMEECVAENAPGGGPGPGPEGPSCAEICDIATGFKCPPWSDGPDAWPDLGLCLEDCQSFATNADSTAYTMYGCAMTSTCDTMEKCTEPPTADDPGCDALCTKAFQACGDIGMPSQEFCTDYCTGQLMVFGANVSAADGLACLEATPLECEQDPYAQVLGCLLDLGSECATICDAMVDCPTENALPLEECMPTCMAGYMNLFGALSTSETAACIAQVGSDCADVESCIAPPMPPTCYGLCSGGTMMCDAEMDSCMSTCEGKLITGHLADVSCEFASQCSDPSLCEALEPGLNVQCVEACMAGPPTICADQPEGCVAACHGLVTGSASNDPALAACISVELGTSCAVDQAYWSCVAF